MGAQSRAAVRSTFLALLTLLWAGAARPAASQVTERLYQQACDQGDFFACIVFGLKSETGDGVPRDLAKAADLYRRACEGGEMSGCTNLALLYEGGRGVVRDSARATGLLRVACEGGETLACETVGPLSRVAAGELTGGFNKSGRIRDEVTGRSLSDAIVDLPDLDLRAIAGDSGRVEFLGLPPGRHALRAQRTGYDVFDGDLEVFDDSGFAILLTPATGVDPRAPSRILGQVREGEDRALTNVEITVVGQPGAHALTDSRGRFTLRGVEPGLVEVRFTLLGFAPRTAVLIAQPGGTSDITVTMSVEPVELEPIEVTARSSFLERSGFYERADLAGNAQFSRRDFETIHPEYLSDLVRRVPGVILSGGVATSMRSGSRCALPVYVDGIRATDSRLDRFAPEELEAVEVYHGTNTPIEYGNACGALLLWTRTGN
ncbi:MAG TPA: carboxypeptidase regulatory-like domain-containing protein [Longimicrobiales bacterium]|nr:carboxypeptidase regulatory-like domain-containing protein [Longimicrobiales bacterium]